EFWPGWLAAESPELAVWSLGYESSSSAWRGHSMPLFLRANEALAAMKAEGLGERPICFVAHSMGGLLVKQLLRNADSLAPEFRGIGDAIRGISFIATPHTGSHVASI